MVPLDRAMTSFYRPSVVTMSLCTGLAAILNEKLLSVAITHCSVRYSRVTLTCMGL